MSNEDSLLRRAAPHHMGSNIEIVIPAFNEEVNLPHALRSVMEWAEAVHVVDSESTDATRAVAEAHGARVAVRPWLGYARQKNWALDHLPLRAPWVFILDADESITPALRDELLAVAARPPGEVPEAGFYVNRTLWFLGRRIRHCGYNPSWNLRFFKRGRARYEEREVHEHMVVDGPTGHLRAKMDHHDRRGLEAYIAKHNRYSTLEAREMLRRRAGAVATAAAGAGEEARLLGSWTQRRRWFKHHVYLRLPARWLLRFIYMYVLRLGFLDGLNGLHFCLFISAYELQITMKMREAAQPAGVGP
jgi:glycosyltransferase involved in cell wall biosynthesis